MPTIRSITILVNEPEIIHVTSVLAEMHENYIEICQYKNQRITVNKEEAFKLAYHLMSLASEL